MSGTPETDAAVMAAGGDWSYPLRECSRRLERERDEAREKMADALQEVDLRTLDFERVKQERDKMQTELEMWRDGNILHEIHRNELEKVERERDEALEALMKIEDLFIDGTDIYADRENMGIIARNALKEAQ
jgi:hypothetical protein